MKNKHPEIETLENQTLTVRAALQDGAGTGERALIAIANKVGDEQTRRIVESLTEAEIASATSEFDMTIPSLVHAFATPEQFVGALLRFGQRWVTIDSDTIEWALRERQRELEAFLCPMICQDDQERAAAMLEEFAQNPLAADALIFLGISRPGYNERLATPNSPTTARGTFEEIYAKTAEFCPQLWEEMKALSLDIEEENDISGFAADFCNNLHDAGASAQDQTEDLKPEDTFLGI